MTGDFVFEIGTEELPARVAPAAAEQLRTLFLKELETLQVAPGEVKSYCTPRRLVLLSTEMKTRQADRTEEHIGPATRVAFDAEGRPTKAALGFARGHGVEVEDLDRVLTPKGEYVCVRLQISGSPVGRLLETVLPRILTRLQFPKSMRWGAGEQAFVRPIHWLLALFNGQVVPFSFAGVTSGNFTIGHRFMAPDPAEVRGVSDYLAYLGESHVVLDPEERKRRVSGQLLALAEEIGARVIENEALLNEVVHLVEKPTATLGHFDEHFLEMPKEILISAMATHQRYFALARPDGALVNAFAVVSNTDTVSPAAVTRGNERVLRARLDDARFFFAADRKYGIEDYLPGLDERIFLKPLGTVRAKTERTTSLTGRLARLLAPAAEDVAVRAATLSKADLCSRVVQEFPDLQGVMGCEYARLSNESDEVADAIFEHYLPRSADDKLPRGDAGALVSIADKADSIVGCFGIGLAPTATQDPYALRRQALGVLRILAARGWTLPLSTIVGETLETFGGLLYEAHLQLHRERHEARNERRRPRAGGSVHPETQTPPAGPVGVTRDEFDEQIARVVLEFLRRRLRQLLRADFPTDVIDAVLEIDSERVPDVFGKVKALAELRREPGFEPLALTFKRVGNIIKDHAPEELVETALQAPEEKALFATHERIRARVEALLRTREFSRAAVAVAELKPAVDLFFDHVMVMVDDESLRRNRVALLQQIAATFRRLAEFGRIAAG